MGTVTRIVLGLGIVGVGVYFVLRTRVALDFFGAVDWAELKFGPGGSNLFYKLLGVVIILVGFIVTMNLWNAFLQGTLGALLSHK